MEENWSHPPVLLHPEPPDLQGRLSSILMKAQLQINSDIKSCNPKPVQSARQSIFEHHKVLRCMSFPHQMAGLCLIRLNQLYMTLFFYAE